MAKECFVFGSNEAGFHGAGAALYAYQGRGARWGMSYGHVGDSFAIPTKGTRSRTEEMRNGDVVINKTIGATLPLSRIADYVKGFLAYAEGRPDLIFNVTRIGCGLAGLKDRDVALLFVGAPLNVYFDSEWKTWLPCNKSWGTF